MVWERGRGDLPGSPGGWDRVWFVLKTHYMELIGLNLLFLIFCIPIVTIPAALAGVTSILMKWTRDEPVIFWEDFFSEFKAGFLKRLLTWLLLILLPVSLSAYPYILGFKQGGSVIFMLTGMLSFLFISYFFPISVLIDIPVGKALKNAVILTFVEWRCTVRILLTAGLLYLLCFIFTLYAVPLLVFGLIALCQLMVCVWVNEPISRLLVIPNA